MTPEEAKAVFDKMLKRYAWAENNKAVQAIKVAKECIEKQIAKKLIILGMIMAMDLFAQVVILGFMNIRNIAMNVVKNLNEVKNNDEY